MKNSKYEVSVDKLRWRCDPSRYQFECTDELTPLQEFIGQKRAIRSIDFGLGMDKKGYNIFVTGLTGTGKASAIKTHLERRVARRKDAEDNVRDWCHIHNFTDQDRPKVLRLPRGQGKSFQDSLERLLEDLKGSVAKAFSGEKYDKQRKEVTEHSQQRRGQVLRQLEEEVNKQGFTVQPSPAGMVLIPLVEGKPISQRDYMALEEKQRRALEDKQKELSKLVNEKLHEVQVLEKEIAEELKNLDNGIADFATSRPFNDLEERYKDFPEILRYLRELKDYTLRRIDLFRDKEAQASGPPAVVMAGTPRERDPLSALPCERFRRQCQDRRATHHNRAKSHLRQPLWQN